ncbi:DUF7537 family lipoprotein [Ruania alba]|uniref:Lipoprotein n=1 Tax=Ruania alba TaxID=648782 RepID=A0A1H5MJK7_9MICO|nr:hypothetical protein [Ruania alba]SEE88578.1 hypothetical protein SAMN04488554_3386 [Ruania alba]
MPFRRTLTVVMGSVLLVAGCAGPEDPPPSGGTTATVATSAEDTGTGSPEPTVDLADPLTPDTIGTRTADAIRAAGSMQFEQTTVDGSVTGAMAYQGTEVVAMEITTRNPDGEVTLHEWFVDGTYWRASDGGAASTAGPGAAEDFLALWNWAGALENVYTDVEAVRPVDETELDGIPVTVYEVALPDRTETWWVDEQDLLRRYTYGDDLGGTLTGFGADLEITPPEG